MKKTFLTVSLLLTILIQAQKEAQSNSLIIEQLQESVFNEKTIPIARMTEKERFNLRKPSNGLVVYQTNNLSGLYYFMNNSWIQIPPDIDTLNSSMICSKVTTVNTVSDLNNLHDTCGTDITTVIVLGYHEKNDGGGGVFVYNSSLSNVNDGGIIFNGWERSITNSSINVKWFGAKGNGGLITDTALIANNTLAFQKTINEFITRYRDITPGIMNNRVSTSGIFIPSGEYILGADALYNDSINFRLVGINYFSDGNAILSLTNTGNTYVFKNIDSGLFFTFSNITFISHSSQTNVFYSQSIGGAQDYYFERCSFFGKYDKVFTIRGGNTNSEWGFNKCTFNGEINTVLDVKDSDQFLNYWFDQTKFWLFKNSRTLVADNGGHFKFINCDWSGLNPDNETYQFELNSSSSARGVNDFRIINGRFELKTQNARVLKSNWNHGNIEISADFGSQSPPSLVGINMKHFEFNLQGASSLSFNALNVNFKNSVMMGFHEINYGNNAWRGTGKILYENCSFPNRNSLDGFIKINHNTNNNKSGVAVVEIRDAIFENNAGISSPNDSYNLEISSVNYLPSYSNSGLKKKYFKIAHPARGENPLANQQFILNFPEEAESIITRVKWFLPKNRLGSTSIVKFVLTDINGNILSEIAPVKLKDGFDIYDDVYINVKNLPNGKIILKDLLNQSNQVANEFLCIIEYF